MHPAPRYYPPGLRNATQSPRQSSAGKTRQETALITEGKAMKRVLRTIGLLIAVFSGLTAWAIAQEAALKVAEPKEAKAAVARTPDPAHWSWGQTDSQITPTGDLVWAPQPFKFEAGKSVRYIDFAAGSDDNDGASKEKPWKHHPWDAAATGAAKACSGIQTYVFKGGVVYRGTLVAKESGAAGDPIRLTRDPAWGDGDAVLSGAEPVANWKQGADNPLIPDAAKVWYTDLPYSPRNLWETGKGGEVAGRLALARTPNWKESDPEEVLGEWFKFEQPEWWVEGKNSTTIEGHKAHLGIDTKNLTQPADYYIGATARVEYGIVMGTPFPTRVEGFDAQKKAIVFQGIWFGDTEKIITNCHYYLEDKPQYLDSPGEFWFDRKQDGSGRLYLRLSGDRDPNTAKVEAGRQFSIIESPGMSHVAITGLTFRFTNTSWDLTQPAWGDPNVANAAIRVRGAADDLRIANCKFDNIAGKAIFVDGTGKPVDHIVVADNDISLTDHGAMDIKVGGPGDVQVLRNNLLNIGERPHRQDHGHALVVEFPATMEIAGNVLTHCYGSGIFVFGGKGSGDTRDVPLSRVLVHHNRAVQTLLQANDWGGIETWQGGPQYVYDNISGDPNGRWWSYNPKNPGSARLGLAFYHDGGYKIYNFNNVAWGNPVPSTSTLRCQAAYYEATPTIENSFFNNTAYAFHLGTNWSPAGGRHLTLGNLFMDISGVVFQHGQLKEDKGPAPAAYQHDDTMAISHNVFSQITAPVFGVFEAANKQYTDLASMQGAMATHKPLAGDIGVMSKDLPVKDAKNHDFHPLPGSAAIDQGVKFFVPWALARTVGEWNFRRDNADPTNIIDNHWNMPPYTGGRDLYYALPTYPLKGVGIAAADYVAGPLEDWTNGALNFNGKDQYAVLAAAELAKPVTYEVEVNKQKQKKTAEGKDLETPDIDTSNLLVEAYLKTADGLAGSVLVSKMADAGYQLAINQAGGVTLTLKSGGQTAELADGAKINDGKWHHVVAEVDRKASTGAIYVDGVKGSAGPMALPAGASLSNAADLTVGKGTAGKMFAGALEFLRIARSTLAESQTSIEELYDWQFDGPFLRDFAGKAPVGKGRDAGAFEVAQ
jgi:hypothetical protein